AFIGKLAKAKAGLLEDAEKLAALKARVTDLPTRERADAIVNEVVPMMQGVRGKCDAVEHLISADIWPYPTYRNLLSLSA
ncbi:MAG: glutamine synthetase type III, partial [Synergistaceae bacterium]|nr:glutamine synthetase type III [Synergistaceae bacterium]